MIYNLIKSAFMIFIMGALLSCVNSIKEVQKFSESDTLSGMAASNIQYTRSDSGKIQLILKSPLLLKHEGKKTFTVFPKGFYVQFFDTTGKVISTLKADYGIRKKNAGILEAKKNVEVKNLKNKETLYTNILLWNERTKKIIAPGPVKIIGSSRTIYGDSLIANENFTHRTIYGIRGVLKVKEDSLQ